MTKFLSIQPIQEPFDLGQDQSGRSQIVFNVNAFCEATEEFLEEAAQVLLDAAVGTLNDDVFVGSRPTMPTGNGPYLSLLETGGLPPAHTQSQVSPPAYQRPSAQVVVRGRSYQAARAMAREAYNAFCGVINEEITVAGNGPLHRRLYATTTDATPTELFRDGAGGTLRVQIPAGVSAGFLARVVGRRTDGGALEVGHYTLEGTISNYAGVVALDGPVTSSPVWEDAPAWAAEATADNTNDALAITVTGAAGATINWQADVYLQRSYG